jgi:hypothetical protein
VAPVVGLAYCFRWRRQCRSCLTAAARTTRARVLAIVAFARGTDAAVARSNGAAGRAHREPAVGAKTRTTLRQVELIGYLAGAVCVCLAPARRRAPARSDRAAPPARRRTTPAPNHQPGPEKARAPSHDPTPARPLNASAPNRSTPPARHPRIVAARTTSAPKTAPPADHDPARGQMRPPNAAIRRLTPTGRFRQTGRNERLAAAPRLPALSRGFHRSREGEHHGEHDQADAPGQQRSRSCGRWASRQITPALVKQRARAIRR